MQVRLVSIRPTDAAENANRYSMTPELLAASGARYSRNNEGLDAIASKIEFGNAAQTLDKFLHLFEGTNTAFDASDNASDLIDNYCPADMDKSVDSIFRVIDYGHASIGDMVPVSLFMDGISIYLAYLLWTQCPVAGGQESSSRYIRFDEDGLLFPKDIGLPYSEWNTFLEQRQTAFDAYNQAVAFWEEIGNEHPELARIPQSLMDDPSDKAQKTVARMKRNYAFDRARVFLPMSAKTNVMMIQSARQWVALVQYLLSSPLVEANRLGLKINEELQLVAPRMVKHARHLDSSANGQATEFGLLVSIAKQQESISTQPSSDMTRSPWADLVITAPDLGQVMPTDVDAALRHHDNRYAFIGEAVRRIGVRFSWDAVGMAEIRDLNRHRTGTKYCPLVPQGFHFAYDQVPTYTNEAQDKLCDLAVIGAQCSEYALNRLRASDPTYMYNTLLGTQFPFEHTTTADKMLYEIELRTGTGAHYRYAAHLRDIADAWFDQYPGTKGLVQIGSAEPE